MAALWSAIVPFITILVLKKLMKALGLGNLFNPTEALAMATGGAAKVMRDGDTGKLAKGARTLNKRTLDKANSAAKWYSGKSLSRRTAGAVAGGTKATLRAAASAVSTVRNGSFAEKAAAKRDALRQTANRLGSSLQSQGQAYRQVFAANRGAGALGAFQGMRAVLGSAGARADARLGAARDTSGFAGRHLLSLLTQEGGSLAGEGRPDLARLLGKWTQKLEPSEPDRIVARHRRTLEAATATATSPEQVAEIRASVSLAMQAALAESNLGPGFNAAGGLSARSVDYLAQSYAQMSGVDPSSVLVDRTTGTAMLLPAPQTGIPAHLTSPDQVLAYASSPLTWMPREVVERGPHESAEAHAFRMRETLVQTGMLDPVTGLMPNFLEYMGIEVNPANVAEFVKLSQGQPSEFDWMVGSFEISQGALAGIQVACAANDRSATSGRPTTHYPALASEQAANAARVPEVHQSLAQATDLVAQLQTSLGSAASLGDLHRSLDGLSDKICTAIEDGMAAAGDALTSSLVVTHGSRLNGRDEQRVALEVDDAAEALADELQGVIEALEARLATIRSAGDVASGRADVQALLEQLAQVTQSVGDRVDDAVRVSARALEDAANAAEEAAGSTRRGVARPSNFANAAEAPLT